MLGGIGAQRGQVLVPADRVDAVRVPRAARTRPPPRSAAGRPNSTVVWPSRPAVQLQWWRLRVKPSRSRARTTERPGLTSTASISATVENLRCGEGDLVEHRFGRRRQALVRLHQKRCSTSPSPQPGSRRRVDAVEVEPGRSGARTRPARGLHAHRLQLNHRPARPDRVLPAATWDHAECVLRGFGGLACTRSAGTRTWPRCAPRSRRACDRAQGPAGHEPRERILPRPASGDLDTVLARPSAPPPPCARRGSAGRAAYRGARLGAAASPTRGADWRRACSASPRASCPAPGSWPSVNSHQRELRPPGHAEATPRSTALGTSTPTTRRAPRRRRPDAERDEARALSWPPHERRGGGARLAEAVPAVTATAWPCLWSEEAQELAFAASWGEAAVADGDFGDLRRVPAASDTRAPHRSEPAPDPSSPGRTCSSASQQSH